MCAWCILFYCRHSHSSYCNLTKLCLNFGRARVPRTENAHTKYSRTHTEKPHARHATSINMTSLRVRACFCVRALCVHCPNMAAPCHVQRTNHHPIFAHTHTNTPAETGWTTRRNAVRFATKRIRRKSFWRHTHTSHRMFGRVAFAADIFPPVK